MKIIIVVIAVIVVLSFGVYFFVLSNRDNTTEDADATQNNQEDIQQYTDITSEELAEMLVNKDFKLIDVHVPEQKHVPDTDYLITYTDIDEFKKIFPNKDEKVVLYCRSGSMSRNMAEKLVEQGYINIYNLTFGMNEWLSEKRDTVPIGSVNN
ncbi:rhodanese-like domain-containing protein [Patescibacteria group bacterium]|nr:rhodanese-like domain-containing protein [Patescibacteria group bacterium]MBU1075368.1 rhodanese-like domain-containing protein [Patescibacteria group bacterium]MBU1951888.1 rhodanese-like domain-containing protein [Patescibacteria group bacterium]